MKAPDFAYCCPDNVDDVCELMAEYGADARVLAGGQSLVPAMNLRLSSAELLIDINRVSALEGIKLTDDGQGVSVGALARHAQVAASPLIRQHVSLVGKAMAYVAHPAVRNRGTTCGSLALADPSAEMPACAVALNACLVLQSKKEGIRRVPAREFFFGLYETARRDDELLTNVIWPVDQPGYYTGFTELSRRHGDFAIAGVAVRCAINNGTVRDLDMVTFGVGPTPVLSAEARDLAEAQEANAALANSVADKVSNLLEIDSIDHEQVRREQVRALVRRVLLEVFQEAACGNS